LGRKIALDDPSDDSVVKSTFQVSEVAEQTHYGSAPKIAEAEDNAVVSSVTLQPPTVRKPITRHIPFAFLATAVVVAIFLIWFFAQ
jgi:hypothetical protein